MIGVIATVRLRAGMEDAFETVWREFAEQVRQKEPGNQLYSLSRTRADPYVYKVIEIYTDKTALKEHTRSEHFRAIWPRMEPCLIGEIEPEFIEIIAQ